MASSLRSNRHSATESQLKYSKRQGSASVEGRKPSCTALLPDGKECRTVVGESHHRFCRQHHREQLRMYNLYKLREGEYNAICVDDNEDDRTKLEEKIRVGEEAVKLRDAVNRRFHSLSGDNRGHIGWILNLRSEIDNLKGASLRSGGPPDSSELSPAPSETKYASSEGGGVRIYKSLISPEVPMSALDHLPRDSPAVVIKASLNMMISSLVDKLSEIAPSLDDSGRSVGDANTAEEQDAGPEDLVVRYILRELLVWKADTETLAKASQTSSIDQFLRRSTPDELEEYIKLFEALGRPDTLHLLRDAVYDYLLLDGSPSTVTIRGASISRNTAERRMTADGWDILHQNFWNLIEWCNVEQLYFSFEDVALVKRLLALRRYDDSEANWFRPSDDVSQECEMAVLQGFDALSKGFSDPPYQQLVSRGGMTTKKESRCYLVGRMGKSDTLALPFIKEISTRVARFIVIAIDMERADWWRQCDPQDNADGNPFITRSRSAKNKADLHNIAWSVEWSAKDNLEDVRQIRAVKDREAFSDFHLIIIIDRLPGRNFTILEAIAEALKEVAGDRTCREIMDRAIRESIPASEREAWSAAVPDDPYSAVVEPGAASPHYEGHRVRQWDLVDKLPGFDKNQARLPQTYAEVRFIRKVLAEMESAKAITLLETFEAPVQATPERESKLQNSLAPAGDAASAGSLYDFAQSYLRSHPEAVFAKGRIDVHYCAWPLKITDHVNSPPNFQTAQGHLYRWNVISFDHPHATQIWQWYLHQIFNQRLPFVCCLLTTFVVCAASRDKAADNLRVLTQEAAKCDLKLSVKPAAPWLGDIESLGLDRLWRGVPPDI